MELESARVGIKNKVTWINYVQSVGLKKAPTRQNVQNVRSCLFGLSCMLTPIPTTMKNLILTAIEKNKTITYSELEARAIKRGVSLDDLDEALAKVQKDKRVKSTVSGSEITYTWSPPKPKGVQTHLVWLRENYPRYDYDMPFPEIDMSFIVLSPKELEKYKTEVAGGFRPKKYARRA